MLLLVALVEVAVNRVARELLRPDVGEPPLWHVTLDYFGLFLFYFTGALALFVIVARCVSALEARRGLRDVVAHGALGVAALVAAIPLLIDAPDWTFFLLEVTFAIALLALVASVFHGARDLGVQVGLPLVVIPLLLHTITVLVVRVWPSADWPGGNVPVGGPGALFVRLGVMALALAALATPYCFAPRPFARAVTKPVPIIIAMSLAALGAVAARLFYVQLAKATKFAIGIEMNPMTPDPKLALYLLALATLAWTLTACATAGSPSRRTIGAGLALILLGGYEFAWPHHWLLPLLGVALVAEAVRTVRDEELEAMPIVASAPPIADSTWSTYVGTIAQSLRRTLGDVHSLTSRGDGGLTSSLIVGDVKGIAVRTRIERLEGSVIALDIVLGREVDEVRGSTLTVWAMPERGTGANPPGPPSQPIFKTGDVAFDDKFRVRGNVAAFTSLFDESARAKAIATLDGWFAYWDREGIRYRVYPGRGAPLDHPLPLSDLALGRVPSSERLAAVVELLVEVGTRVLEPPPRTQEPAELDVEGAKQG